MSQTSKGCDLHSNIRHLAQPVIMRVACLTYLPPYGDTEIRVRVSSLALVRRAAFQLIHFDTFPSWMFSCFEDILKAGRLDEKSSFLQRHSSISPQNLLRFLTSGRRLPVSPEASQADLSPDGDLPPQLGTWTPITQSGFGGAERHPSPCQ